MPIFIIKTDIDSFYRQFDTVEQAQQYVNELNAQKPRHTLGIMHEVKVDGHRTKQVFDVIGGVQCIQ